uniref:Trimeric autotransporter adhesin YadA-like head domain-containing protein n=1 Tax=viral metagenome TaxID=1070528 RepID=A0A6C0BDM0_9ZZZZ
MAEPNIDSLELRVTTLQNEINELKKLVFLLNGQTKKHISEPLSFGDKIAIGTDAGKIDQDSYAIAVGANAGNNNQSEYAIALGRNAGSDTQGTLATAIGSGAGSSNQKCWI